MVPTFNRMDISRASGRRLVNLPAVLESALPRSYTNAAGRWLLDAAVTARQILAFALITLGVMATRFRRARATVRPLIAAQIARSGIWLLPMVGFLAVALGFVVIGQMVALLSHVGAQNLVGMVMVTTVVRELGPLVTALVVLLRVGAATVIELGTARALGEVEALEALGIDPVHYLVVPRVVGLAIATAALTVYFILATVFSGYLFAFVQDVPLTPGEYFSQIALALRWEDFVLLALKSLSFGGIVAIVSSFQGLARPLQLTEVSRATTNAVVASTLACVALDALFIVVYLLR
jgi:phospholipid/cholesterol/gamma-HCH transport system permease protein